MSIFESLEFQQLKAQWYRKARESGFKDIEYSPDGTMLAGVNGALLASEGALWVESKAEYFYRATHWVSQVKPGKRRRVWQLHSDGVSLTDIARKTGIKRSTAYYWISKERAKMLGY